MSEAKVRWFAVVVVSSLLACVVVAGSHTRLSLRDSPAQTGGEQLREALLELSDALLPDDGGLWAAAVAASPQEMRRAFRDAPDGEGLVQTLQTMALALKEGDPRPVVGLMLNRSLAQTAVGPGDVAKQIDLLVVEEPLENHIAIP